MQKQKSPGGLEAANIELYYLANQLKYLIKWFNPQSKLFWLQTDRALCRDILLLNLPFIRQTFHSISIESSLSAWWEILPTLQPHHLLTLLFGITQIINQKKKKTLNFTSSKIRGITHLCHFTQNKTFINFYNLIQVFGNGNSVS